MKEHTFLWGSATASYQCEGAWKEGNKGLSYWDEFSHHSEFNINNVTGDEASDFYHKYKEDIKMLKDSGQNTFRMSISWPRIMPAGKGDINQEGVEFYHKVFACLNRNGIEPNVTLYHWDMPLELYENSGWENFETAYDFAEYAKFCFNEFGNEVKIWTTVNEPMYYMTCKYGVGNYPPHVQNMQSFIKAGYIYVCISTCCTEI